MFFRHPLLNFSDIPLTHRPFIDPLILCFDDYGISNPLVTVFSSADALYLRIMQMITTDRQLLLIL